VVVQFTISKGVNVGFISLVLDSGLSTAWSRLRYSPSYMDVPLADSNPFNAFNVDIKLLVWLWRQWPTLLDYGNNKKKRLESSSTKLSTGKLS